MRLFAWIYVNLKQMIKQFPITILYMIGLPLIIGILMGNMMDMLFENPNNMDPITIQVIDEDFCQGRILNKAPYVRIIGRRMRKQRRRSSCRKSCAKSWPTPAP